MKFSIGSNKNLAVILLLLLILLVAGFYTYKTLSDEAKQKWLSENPAAQAFFSEYTDLDGNPISLADFIGRVIVVNVWASWSPSSGDELRKLAEISNDLDKERVQILAINRAETPHVANRYLNRIGVSNEVMLVLDPNDKYYKTIGGYAMPETIIYDQEGGIFKHVRGNLDKTEIIADLELLSKNPVR